MEEELLCKNIKLAKERRSKEALGKILIKMQPLVKKYVRKLFFMEKDDAFQELNLALIEAVYHLKSYKNDAMCLKYLQISVINRYNHLCKVNINLCNNNDQFENISEVIPLTEKYNDIEFYIDMNEFLKDKNDRQRNIINYILHDFSDREIALKMGISRQFVNREKKRLFTNTYNK
ncbi:MAG TPA: sigma-70 family RNA polymerase sigma factor [Lachnospiraceae bacterium]|nr:sigma-70 family RNA polymerase sigma factor [Lachnospiraceae bacterium]